jgi:hypothetical protein
MSRKYGSRGYGPELCGLVIREALNEFDHSRVQNWLVTVAAKLLIVALVAGQLYMHSRSCRQGILP